MVTSDLIKEGFKVLLLWGGSSPPSDLESTVNQLKEKVGLNGKVQVEHETMLSKSQHGKSEFDVTIAGSPSSTFQHSDEILAEVLHILKPNSSFFLWESKATRTLEDLKSALTLNGFTSIVENESSDQSTFEVKCQKPNFEVGKSSKLPLSFAKKAKNSDAAKIWSLSAADMNDDDVEIIDSDSLLDANDFKRPDLASAKTDCGTSKGGRKKACKGCTCGLKEELEGSAPPLQKSACGSCYLGDAFRCASCPYLGMPPFKPGEQVTLSDRQLNPDLQA